MKLRWLFVEHIWECADYIPEFMLRKTYEKRKLQMKVRGKWTDIPMETKTIRHPRKRKP